ncbi:MAG: KH domain-containing protein [Clostridia bacterium]|nr:KH domain-containing protein [Clostridia bacterium]
MEELVRVLAEALVTNPEAVQVSRRDEEDKIIIELRVAPEDMGKVIGKQGRIARAIRTVVRAAATRENKKVIIDIVE